LGKTEGRDNLKSFLVAKKGVSQRNVVFPPEERISTGNILGHSRLYQGTFFHTKKLSDTTKALSPAGGSTSKFSEGISKTVGANIIRE